MRNGTSTSRLFRDSRWHFVKFGGDGTGSEKMHPLQKKISIFLFFFLGLYLFFISSPQYHVLGFRSIKSRDLVENPFSLWISVNLGATLCRKRTVSQRNTEAAQGTTEKKPRVELIDRISNIVSYKRDIDSIIFNL